MLEWECGSTVEQLHEMCAKIYEWLVEESRQESKKSMD